MVDANDSMLGGVSPEDQEILLRFFDQTSELMTVVDCEARILYVNSACQQVYGLPPSELVGMLAFDFVHEEDREQTMGLFQDWMKAPDGSSGV